ncbi:MAG: phenylacetate--CoA ligase family protein, partial [Nitrospinota bacterium]
MRTYSTIRAAGWFFTGYPATRYARLLQRAEQWSRVELEEYRNAKIRDLITHCYDNVPYYRRVMEERKLLPQDIQRAEDLARLPILTKRVIQDTPDDLLARNVASRRVSWSKTGGTTGQPTRVCKNIECIAWESMCHERGLRWGGLGPDEPRIRLFGGSLGINRTRWTTRLRDLFLRRDLFLPAFELRTDTVAAYGEKIRRSKYRFLVGYASAIYRLAVLAEEMHQPLTFDAVFPTAELLLPEWAEVIRTAFKCAVLPYYGCGEVNSLGYSIPGSRGYLIPEEHVLIEIMHPDGSTQGGGEGQFLITDLDNYAMPVIRYANGDAGQIGYQPQGPFPFTRIERLDGRYNSFLMTDTGELISGVIGTHVFRNLPSVKSYRIIQ